MRRKLRYIFKYKVQRLCISLNVKLLTLCDKEVEHGEDHCVATEHVVTTCMHSGEGHPKTTPDGHSPLQFGPHVTVHLGRRKVKLLILLFQAGRDVLFTVR